MKDLLWTGERLVTSVVERHGVIEHLHRYALAMQLSPNKTVLDIASGEGYGGFLLSKNAEKVFGVDIDKESVDHANEKYSEADNLKFLHGSTTKIPLPDNSIELVVSFETLEHHKEHDLMMLEILRVLKKDGCLLLSSPEKSIYKERDANNPYHLKELPFLDFKTLLERYFKNVHFFSQRFIIGSLIHSNRNDWNSNFKMFDGTYSDIIEGLQEDSFYNKPFFNLALCSISELSNFSFPYYSLFNGVNVIQKELDDLNEKYIGLQKINSSILNSNSFKIARYIIKIFSFFKRKHSAGKE